MLRVNYDKRFGDKRLEQRGLELQSGLFRNSVHSIQQIATTRAEQKAYYRFLRNEKVSEEKLENEIAERCGQLVNGKVVLCIQDTTEINLKSHVNRLDSTTGVGGITDHKGGIGFFIHPSFVIDACSNMPLGFSSIKTWNREHGKPNRLERDYKHLPIEEKESFKWIEGSRSAKSRLANAEAIVIVQDREGDIFEQFSEIPDEKTFLLVRSMNDRMIGPNEKLWGTLSESPVLGHYEISIKADERRKTIARIAKMEVRCISAEIRCPQRRSGRNLPKKVKIYAVEAREADQHQESPVLWRLVTTCPIVNIQDCMMILEWYSWRWMIEELFRALKKEGFQIESSELENGWAIRKLAIMMMDTIVKLMQMQIAYQQPEDAAELKAEMIFDIDEQKCLTEAGKKLAGKTQKLQNPYPSGSLNWATWIIARQGGWKGYASQKPPGLTTLQIGLAKFYSIYAGWELVKDMGTP